MISVIYERAFKTSTTYSFACMIFQLCMDAGVPLWHFDVLPTPNMTVDIDLIRDETNMAVPEQGPKVDLQPVSENLVDTLELA